MCFRVKRVVFIILWIVLAILLLIFSFYNYQNNEDFWNALAVNCITIGMGFFISYFLVQRKNNLRKQKDIILELILKLQVQITAPEAYNFSNQTSEEITMRKRDFSNKINILKQHKDAFGIAQDIDFIEERFQEYEKLIGVHISDLDYLRRSVSELQRPLYLIGDKLFAIALQLYK